MCMVSNKQTPDFYSEELAVGRLQQSCGFGNDSGRFNSKKAPLGWMFGWSVLGNCRKMVDQHGGLGGRERASSEDEEGYLQ